ncbi:MAG: MarR family transcriptional regulator [Candidatus Omnitrophica bacterium]|nr:MarR family transcriptional regulator [Candidatus Omnitrophota bacterium]
MIESFSEEISKLMPEIMRSVHRKMEPLFEKGKVSFTHIIVMEFLAQAGSAKMSEVSKILSLNLSSATSIIDKMVEMGFVKRTRSPKDRRVVLVELLKKGKTFALAIMGLRKEATQDMFSELTNDEKNTYLKLIRKVHDNVCKKFI